MTGAAWKAPVQEEGGMPEHTAVKSELAGTGEPLGRSHLII